MTQSIREALYQNIPDYKAGMELPDEITVLYSRLSRDDKDRGKEDESNSIVNQKKLHAKFAYENRLPNPIYFTDDGVSGTTFDRPDFSVALELVEAGRVKNFVVKDMSRFGRDYVRVGFYTENVFPDMDVRFIAIADGVDSSQGENEMMPFKNIFNEWYARNISKKVKDEAHRKGMAGEHLAVNAPYGYKKDPANPKRWIIDEVAAEVVRKIFHYCLEGWGVTHIAVKLREMQIEAPTVHAISAGYRKDERILNPYDWLDSTVAKILERREYLGHTINFKTYRKSYKNKKMMFNDPSNYAVFENTHPPIIEAEVFERVQQIRSNKRRRNRSGRVSTLSGLVYCAECKGKMNLSSGAALKPEQDFFACVGFRTKKTECQSSHYIRRVVLEQVVLEHIQNVTTFASEHEKVFVQMLKSQDDDKLARSIAKDKKLLEQLEKRVVELDTIIQRLYEDMVAGTLTNERFMKFSQGYEKEQKDLEIRVEVLRGGIAYQEEASVNVDKFLARVRKYTNITELSTLMLNRLVERIEVHSRGERYSKGVQQIEVYFNDVGKLDLPTDLLPLEQPRPPAKELPASLKVKQREKIPVITALKG